jgi:acetamidase/formamidase
MKHNLEAKYDTVHWGILSSDIEPVLTINSGDHIEITTVSGPPEVVANCPYKVKESLLEIHAKTFRGTLQGGHVCTGPIDINGSKKGEVLQVEINSVNLDSDWAYTGIAPLKGALPDDFKHKHVTYLEIDKKNKIAKTPWGMNIDLDPFFGVITTAPPIEWGKLPTVPPRKNGGNMDNKELKPGSTLYLPIFNDGALFSVGDGHGTQGDGEICTAAVEMDMRGEFVLKNRSDMSLEWPFAETQDFLITMAFDPDLDECVKIVTREMIKFLNLYGDLSREDAYTLLSYVGDLRITQVVNGNKGVHLMLPKKYFNKTFRI